MVIFNENRKIERIVLRKRVERHTDKFCVKEITNKKTERQREHFLTKRVERLTDKFCVKELNSRKTEITFF